MAKYGRAAETAARFLVTRQESEPRAAWQRAVSEVFPDSATARDKGCPRDSFLSLCESGAIKQVPSGVYTRSVKNKTYMHRALSALRADPNLLLHDKQLWLIATGGADTAPNYQIDVLTTLWRAGLIKNPL
jgi:hypothetical protein